LSQWAPGGRGPRCLAPAAPMVVTPLPRMLFSLVMDNGKMLSNDL